MSLSKLKASAAAAEPQRQPKCTRCRYHGLVVPQKGHLRRCPFLACGCSRCLLVTERTRITALQRNLRAEPPRANPRGGARASAAPHKCNDAAAPEPQDPQALLDPLDPQAPQDPLDPQDPQALLDPQDPLDLRSGAAVARQNVARSDSADVGASAEAPRSFTPSSVSCGELRPSAAVPFIRFPFRMCGHYPSSYAPCPAFMINMPFVPRVAAEQYNHSLYRPLMFPHFQEGAVRYPPLPQPRPRLEYTQGIFILQPHLPPGPFQEELMSRQPSEPPLAKHPDPDTQPSEPPLTKHPDPDIVEVD